VSASIPRPSILDKHAARAIDDDVDESPWRRSSEVFATMAS
jgi:hypothetical protein